MSAPITTRAPILITTQTDEQLMSLCQEHMLKAAGLDKAKGQEAKVKEAHEGLGWELQRYIGTVSQSRGIQLSNAQTLQLNEMKQVCVTGINTAITALNVLNPNANLTLYTLEDDPNPESMTDV